MMIPKKLLTKLLKCGLVAVPIVLFSLFTWVSCPQAQVNKPIDKTADVEAVKPAGAPHDEKSSSPKPPPAEAPDKKESPAQEENPWGDGESVFDSDMGC